MSGAEELPRLLDMITTDPARVLALPENRLRPGDPADLVAFDAPTDVDALRLVAPRTLVLRGGRVLARTEPARTTVSWDGVEEEVTFLR
jgi:cytosine/creatinine deaminase